MANIKQYLDNILNAIFGKDVRQSIHDGIDAINKEVINTNNLSNTTKARQDVLEQKYDEQIKNIASSEPQNAEIVDARNGFDTLGAIIKQKVYQFSNVQAMKNCLTLSAGDVCQTTGYYQSNDGGAGTYLIVNSSAPEDDGGSIHILKNGFMAKLIIKDNAVSVNQFGARGDGITNDTESINKCIAFAKEKNAKVVMPYKYLITEPIVIDYNYFDISIGEIINKGTDYSLIISSASFGTCFIDKIRANEGKGVKLTSSSPKMCAYNNLHIGYIISSVIAIHMLGEYGIQYNDIHFNSISATQYGILLEATKGGWVTECRWYGGQIHGSEWGIYTNSSVNDSNFLVTTQKFYNVGLEGLKNGAYLKDVIGFIFNYPRTSESIENFAFKLADRVEGCKFNLGTCYLKWIDIANHTSGRNTFQGTFFTDGGSVANFTRFDIVSSKMENCNYRGDYLNCLSSEQTLTYSSSKIDFSTELLCGEYGIILDSKYYNYKNVNTIFMKIQNTSPDSTIKDENGNLIYDFSTKGYSCLKLTALPYNLSELTNNKWVVEEL